MALHKNNKQYKCTYCNNIVMIDEEHYISSQEDYMYTIFIYNNLYPFTYENNDENGYNIVTICSNKCYDNFLFNYNFVADSR